MSGELAVVRSLGSQRSFQTLSGLEDLEQELVDQFCLAAVASGVTDHYISSQRSTVFEFVRFLGRPMWTATPSDGDRFLTWLRRDRRQARSTVQTKGWTVASFFDFVIARYQGDIHALAGAVVVQPIDEFNRPTKSDRNSIRVPPSTLEIESMFTAWAETLPDARKYLPAARDYTAASLWRRGGLRINESKMLDVGDWRRDLGPHGKLHVRFGKGHHGTGAKVRLVPGINGIDALKEWWMNDVRHQFDNDWDDPAAPMFPSERRDSTTGRCARIGTNPLRTGFTAAVATWLPDWAGRLTPHGMRHFCASSLYERGIDLKAIQELLGHNWLSTTTRYIHVHDDHIEQAWTSANERVTTRLNQHRGDRNALEPAHDRS